MAIKTLTEKQLGQLQPAAATATSIYSPAASTTAIIKTITIVNHDGGTSICKIYIDDNGTTYGVATEVYRESIATGVTTVLNVYMPMNDSTGNIAVESNTGNVTFTVFGAEIT